MTGISTATEHRQQGTVAFLWDNYGPLHVDRCEAVSQNYSASVIGIELNERSKTYDWLSPQSIKFEKITLRSGNKVFSSYFSIVQAVLKSKSTVLFFCHYDRLDVFLSSITLRLLGLKCFTMLDSKFDDYERHFWRELGKRLFLSPYQGALVASERSRDYARFLGIHRDRIALGYDTANLDRIRENATSEIQVPFDERPFLVVARLVEKKDIFSAIDAYRIFRENGGVARGLSICGSGPLEADLKSFAQRTGFSEEISFTGFLQSDAISSIMRGALVLILPSKEEQFGQVVVEALALDLPVLLSTPCGARDELIRTGVNGFIFEPGNREGLAKLLAIVSSDERLWRGMREKAREYSALGSAHRFAEAVVALSRQVGVTLSRSNNNL